MDITTHHSAFLFHQTAAQVRRSGQRGGRATARNRRLRAAVAAPQDEVAPVERPDETAAEAIAVLDAQFPWLRGAPQRRRPRQP